MTIPPVSELLRDARTRAGLSQRALAERARTAQPLVARIEGGTANPTIDTLERLVNAAGFSLQLRMVPRATSDPVVDAYKRDVDRTLLRENLKKTPHERVAALVELSAFANEITRATAAARRARVHSSSRRKKR